MDIEHLRRRSRAGLTLVELLSTLATASIVLAIAVPSYQVLVQRSRVTSASHSLYSHLQLARSEAVHRAERVVMCPSHNHTNCAESLDWSRGWILFLDRDRDRQRQDGEPLLRVQNEEIPDLSVQTTSLQRIAISYQPDGTVTGDSNTHFRICVDGPPERNRAVIVSNVGRPRISRRGPGNQKVVCP
jgi:type IV fimbrial biogenesis protein FimT